METNKEEKKIIATLNDIIEALKLYHPDAFGDLGNKPIRLCIDSKQVIVIDSIEIYPRIVDLTLMVTTSVNVGYKGTVDIPIPEKIDDSVKEEPEVPMITQDKLSEEFKTKTKNGNSEE